MIPVPSHPNLVKHIHRIRTVSSFARTRSCLPKLRGRKLTHFFLSGPSFRFFQISYPKHPKNQIFSVATRRQISRHICFVTTAHSRASNNGCCLRFKPLVAEKEREEVSFLNRFFLHTYIYIYKQRKNKKVKEKRSLNRRRFGKLIS